MIELMRSNVEKHCKNLPVLAKEGMLKSRSDDWGWFVSDKFILPFYIDKRLIFKRMVFTTECHKLDDSATLEEEKTFLNNVVDYCKENTDIDFIAKAQSNAVFRTFPDGSDYVEWGTMVVDLNKSEDELFASFERKCRNIIRKSIDLGTTVEETDDVKLIYECIRDTLRRQNSPYLAQYKFFEELKNNLKDNVKFYIAKNKDTLQGVSVVLFDDKDGYYYYSGTAENSVPGSINLLQFEIMKDLMKKGIKKYDLVGVRLNVKKDSKYAAIRRFKERFKPELIEGFAFRVVLKPLKYAIFNVMIKIYFALKGMRYIDPIDQIKSDNY